jgi:hypothetical protein
VTARAKATAIRTDWSTFTYVTNTNATERRDATRNWPMGPLFHHRADGRGLGQIWHCEVVEPHANSR